MSEHISIEKIKDNLIQSCLKFDSKLFLPFLISDKVKTHYSNKIKFYCTFKSFLKTTKEDSIGHLSYKIRNFEKVNDVKNYDLDFYDEVYEYPRIYFTVKESRDYIELNVLPF